MLTREMKKMGGPKPRMLLLKTQRSEETISPNHGRDLLSTHEFGEQRPGGGPQNHRCPPPPTPLTLRTCSSFSPETTTTTRERGDGVPCRAGPRNPSPSRTDLDMPGKGAVSTGGIFEESSSLVFWLFILGVHRATVHQPIKT
jgi:hypothetical protein